MKILLAVLLPLLATVPLYAAELPLAARLAEVNGEVSARASSSASWVAVKDGTMIAPGGEVRTAKGSSVVVVFSDKNKVRLNSATVFGIDGATTLKTNLRLFSGKIQAWVKRVNKADFTVRHVAGVAAVRGTILEAEGTTTGLRLTLFEGAMDVVDAFGNSTSMTPGQTSSLSQTGGNQGVTATPSDVKTPAEPEAEAPAPPDATTTQTEGEEPPPEEIAAVVEEPAPASPVQESATTTTADSTVSPSAPPP